MKKYILLIMSFLSYFINAQNTTLPNVIFILADDLGYGDTEPYGQKIIKTPNLNTLTAEGMKFTDFYAGTAVCAPSRASIITGQTTGETHIRGNKEVTEPIDGQASILANSPSIAKIFKNAGYNTGCFGKWALGTIHSDGNPLLQGFDTFFGYNSQFRAHRRYPAFLWHNNEKFPLTENGFYEHQKIYAEDVIQEKILDYIKEQSPEKPFFMWLTYTLPHAELSVPKDSIYTSYEYLPKKSFQGEDYDKITKEPFGWAGYMSAPHSYATYAAMVSRLDKYLGEIRKILKEKHLDNNTILIFTSDNGAHNEGGADPEFFQSAGGFRGLKRDLYEGGIRTPFIIYWKGKIAEGSINNHIGAFWDLLPTFAEITKQNYQSSNHQISFLPTLLGKKQKKHQYLYWEFHEMNGRQAVRYGKWKGVRLNVDDDANAPVELYNLEKDPSEKHNIAHKHPKIVKKIQQFMKESHSRSELFPFRWEK
ncbi:MAG: arylsulfatase [Capnocytophaga sp.]|nr:arylsulfatase [Capnocytophaga sp.]